MPNEPTYLIPSYSLSAIRDLLVGRGRTDRGRLLGGIRARHRMGGSPQAEGRGPLSRADRAPGTPRGAVDRVSAAARQRQGHRRAGLHRASGRAAAARAARAAPPRQRYCASEAGCREDSSRHPSRPARCSAPCSAPPGPGCGRARRSDCSPSSAPPRCWPRPRTGPMSSIVLVMELTGRDRSFILPMLLAVVTATVVARTLDCPLHLRCPIHRSRSRCRAQGSPPRLGVEWSDARARRRR